MFGLAAIGDETARGLTIRPRAVRKGRLANFCSKLLAGTFLILSSCAIPSIHPGAKWRGGIFGAHDLSLRMRQVAPPVTLARNSGYPSAVRFPDEIARGLDAAAAAEPDKPSRSELIRQIVTEWLKAKGMLE